MTKQRASDSNTEASNERVGQVDETQCPGVVIGRQTSRRTGEVDKGKKKQQHMYENYSRGSERSYLLNEPSLEAAEEAGEANTEPDVTEVCQVVCLLNVGRYSPACDLFLRLSTI